MSSPTLFWWFFRRAFLVLGTALFLLVFTLVRAANQLAYANQQNDLQLRAIAARDFIARHHSNDQAAMVDYTTLCRDVARDIAAKVAVIRADGTVLGDSQYGQYTATNLASQVEVLVALNGGFGYEMRETPPDAVVRQHAAVPLWSEGRVSSVVHISAPLERSLAVGPLLLKSLFITAVAIGLALMVVTADLTRRLNRTVNALVERLGQFLDDEQSSGWPQGPTGEFSKLSAAFDILEKETRVQRTRLQRRSRQWKALFSTMQDGVMSINNGGQIVTINPAAQRFLRLEQVDLEHGGAIELTVRNADFHQFVRRFTDTDDANAVLFDETEIEFADLGGDPQVLRLSGVRFHADPDAAAGVLIVIHDITGIRRLETLRKDFVANVSHELKTPLTSIKAASETVEDCIEHDPHHAVRFIATITRQCERMQSIIDDLLTLSKLEESHRWVQDEAEAGNLRMTVERAVSVCNEQHRDRGLQFSVDIPQITLYANHNLLEQVFINLLENAAKYSTDDKRVDITGGQVGDSVEVRVTDHGIGIAREHHARVFERFYRVDKARDRRSGGTGLGLSIVKHIVRLHHGTVDIQSELGKGSTFIVRLPITQNGKTAASTRQQTPV